MPIDQASATLAAAGATLVVGIVVAIIAFNQWRVARAKFRLDLYQERFSFYSEVVRALREVALQEPPEGVNALLLKGSFLFGREVQACTDRIYEFLGSIYSRAADTICEEKMAEFDRQSIELKQELEKLVAPYMSLAKWK